MASAPRPYHASGGVMTRRMVDDAVRRMLPEILRGQGMKVNRQGRMISVNKVPTPTVQSFAHIRRFEVQSVSDDYLTCHTYDMEEDGTPHEGSDNVYVAKPYGLRGGGGDYAADDLILAVRNIIGSTGVSVGAALVHWEAIGTQGLVLPSAGETINLVNAAGPHNLTADESWHDLDLSGTYGTAVVCYEFAQFADGRVHWRYNGSTGDTTVALSLYEQGSIVVPAASGVVEYFAGYGVTASVYVHAYWS